MAAPLRSFLFALAFFMLSMVSLSEAGRGRPDRRPSWIPTVDLSKYSPMLNNGKPLWNALRSRAPHPSSQFVSWQIVVLRIKLMSHPNIGSDHLALPPAPSKLKYITLGYGTQNYTCEKGGPDAPQAIGAEAKLIDACVLFLPLIPTKKALQYLNEFPELLYQHDYAALDKSPLPIIGHHYFANTGPKAVNGTPTFDLGSNGFLSAKKDKGIKAPGGVGVDWLQLSAKEPSTKLTAVYRLQTYKGQAPKSCAGQPEKIQVRYAAQYWFYG